MYQVKDMQTLANIEKGKIYAVKTVHPCSFSAKLIEMGLYSGQEVQVLFHAPFGDPIAVNVGGYVLSLRINEASFIEVA